MKYHRDQTRESLTPRQALEILKDGNKRFCNNLTMNRNHLESVSETSQGQWPFAAILSCSDSRIPTELVFDQGLGDIFSVRLAGNIASPQAIASMEYSFKVLGSKILVVLGHTGCGAVKAAVDGVEMGHLGSLTKMITPAMDAETETVENRTSSNPAFLNNVLHKNVHRQIQNIVSQSEIIRQMVIDGEIAIIGSVYDISTGCVEFFEEMFDIKDLQLSEIDLTGA